jgi:uncharacterized protein (TIGR02246 family)
MTTDDDISAIRRIISAEEIAWNAGDADSYAAQFHAEGSFTNIFGDLHIGQEAFRARHAALFGTFAKGSKASFVVQRLHFPAPTVATIDIECQLRSYGALPPGVVEPKDGVLRTRLLQVLVKEHGQWWTVAYHNVDVKPLPNRPPS